MSLRLWISRYHLLSLRPIAFEDFYDNDCIFLLIQYNNTTIDLSSICCEDNIQCSFSVYINLITHNLLLDLLTSKFCMPILFL